jgi:hypothetical protein
MYAFLSQSPGAKYNVWKDVSTYPHFSSPKRLNELFGMRLNRYMMLGKFNFIFYQFNLTPTFVKLKSNLIDLLLKGLTVHFT